VRNEKLAKEMEKTDSLDREIREENEQIAFTSEVLKSNIKNFKTTVKSFKEIIEDVERRARGVEAVEIVSDEFIQKAEKAANRANSPEEANIIKEEVEAYRNEIKNGQTATTPLTKKQVKNIAKET
jgi:hypothetical protein